LLLPQGGRLLVEERLQSAFGHAGGRGLSDLLHRVEIDIESRTLVAEGAAGDDLAPLRRELPQFIELLGRERSPCHDASHQRVTAEPGRGLAHDGLRNPTSQDKAVHDLAAGGITAFLLVAARHSGMMRASDHPEAAP
jgi:hypothetical protein